MTASPTPNDAADDDDGRLRVEALHTPMVLSGGRTPVRVVVHGPGLLVVDGQLRLVRGTCDAVFLVRSRPSVRVRWLGLSRRERIEVALMPRAAPVRMQVGSAAVDVPTANLTGPILQSLQPRVALPGDR
jgi:hypothetical protein